MDTGSWLVLLSAIVGLVDKHNVAYAQQACFGSILARTMERTDQEPENQNVASNDRRTRRVPGNRLI
jgi:hypothetical protein